MGRQHTTWISDETWERLKDIPGDSTSERLRNAVKFADPNEGMRARAIERNRDELRVLMQTIWTGIQTDAGIEFVKELLELNEWMWNQ